MLDCEEQMVYVQEVVHLEEEFVWIEFHKVCLKHSCYNLINKILKLAQVDMLDNEMQINHLICPKTEETQDLPEDSVISTMMQQFLMRVENLRQEKFQELTRQAFASIEEK